MQVLRSFIDNYYIKGTTGIAGNSKSNETVN